VPKIVQGFVVESKRRAQWEGHSEKTKKSGCECGRSKRDLEKDW